MDDADFQRLYERYNRAIYTFFANRGFCREESRDLVQETYLAAYHGRAGFRNEGSPAGWLFGIAANVWRERVRDQKRFKRDAQVISLAASKAGDEGDPARVAEIADATPESLPLARYLVDEKNRLLYDALQELPDRMRLGVVLLLRGYKYREIADILRVSTNTIRSQLFDAREKLRRRLAGHFSESPPLRQRGSKR